MAFMTRSGGVIATGPKLAAGGQGEVFAVSSPAGVVFKLYLPGALASDAMLEQRLRVMVAHPPTEWREPGGHVTLAWPTEVVADNGRFAGFLMPAVDMNETVGLHRVTNPTDRQGATGPTAWVQGFTWKYLVHTAVNLAHATHLLHQAGVVIGDFNESNIRVTRDARVTFLDCDSMQISDPVTGQRFYCPVGRPEFTPPELLNANWKITLRHPSSDLFALAIHLYQLLLEGEHPFRGAWHGSGEKPPVPELARQGEWAHRPGGQLTPRRAAIPLTLLPTAIVTMFRQAFEDGAANPAARPDALRWQHALMQLEASLTTCHINRAHCYPVASPACPWCEHAAQVPPPAQTGQQPLPLATAPTVARPVRVATAAAVPVAPAVVPAVTAPVRRAGGTVPRGGPAVAPGRRPPPPAIRSLTAGDVGLRAGLGLSSLLWLSEGAIVSGGWVFGALFAALAAGSGALLGWIIGGVAVIFLALAYSELSTMFPVAGGPARFPQQAFGNLAGAAFGWFGWLQAVAIAPLEATATETYASFWWPALVGHDGQLSALGYLLAVLLMAGFTAINFAGVRAVARVNSFLTRLKLAIPLLAILVLLTKFRAGNFAAGGEFLPYGMKGVVGALGGGGIMFAYFGFEQAGQLASEARNPQRDIPRAIIGSVAIATVLYVLLQFVFIGALPAGLLSHGIAGLGASSALSNGFTSLAGLLGLGWLALILRISTVVSTAGVGLNYATATPRVSYGLARSGFFPAGFSRADGVGVPRTGAIAAFVMGLALLLPFARWNQIVSFLTGATVLMYAGAPLALGSFRRQFPAQPRPFKMPAAGLLAPVAFIIANLLIYWTGWHTIKWLGLALIVGYAVIGLVWLLSPAQRPATLDWRSAQWLPVYLAGMGIISWLGSYGGGTGHLTSWLDIVVVAGFSLVIYFWAMAARL